MQATPDDGLWKVRKCSGQFLLNIKSKAGERSRGRPKVSFPWIAPLYLWYVPYMTEC